VVSTDLTGPKDYLTPDNARLVDRQRQEVAPGEHPHPTEPSWWADPDETSALQQLPQGFKRAKKGPSTQGQYGGANFVHAALASQYRPIPKTYPK